MKNIKLIVIGVITLCLLTGCFNKDKKEEEVIINDIKPSVTDVQEGIKLTDTEFVNNGNSFILNTKVTNTTSESKSFKVVLNLLDEDTKRIYGSNDETIENLEANASKDVTVTLMGMPQTTDTYEVIIELID